jgi:ATP-dependent DNA helicase RecG
MELEKLIAQPESKLLEFKRDLSSLDPILKTIVAFANTAGGTLIIGCSKDGIVGVKDVFKAEESLANSIADNIRPPILPEIEIATLQGKDLLVIKVAYWKAPFYLKREGMPKGVYIRLGSTSRPAGAELLAELQRTVLMQSFDQQPLSDLSKASLNEVQMLKAFKKVGKKISDEKLLSLGVLVPSGRRTVPTIGGLILFGKKQELDQLLPEARVSCARFLGDSKTSILDRYEGEGTIADAIYEIPKFIARNTRLTAEIKSIHRKDIPEYPPIAIREALVNALAHADYSTKGSHIQIAIYDNRLEIQNPGMLPFGFTFEDLKAGVSRVRNRVIARVFHELQLMEEWGSGYKRIIEACREGGYPEPKWEELGTSIRVTFYPHAQTQLFGKIDSEIEEREQRILSLFDKEEPLPFREIYKRLSPPISERTLRYDLKQLQQKNLLVSKGNGRGKFWKKT